MKLFKKSDSDNVYHFAVVGFPNSGKSTFLARLYGSSTMSRMDGDIVSRSKNEYLISFGLATEMDARKRASLSFVQKLWNDITSHSNREFRGKTADKSYLTFHVEGGSIKGPRVVETADVPGDIFKFEEENHKDEEYVAAGLKDENIRKFQEEFNRLCPKCNAVLIVVAAEMFDMADRQNLIRSIIQKMGERNESGKPIFKIIAVSKSASRVAPDGDARKAFNSKLKDFEKELCTANKTKGLIRCVACDALEDLIKDGDGWRLPKYGEEVNLPKGVMTPSEVMKLFFDMEAAFYARRRFRIIASATLVIVSLLGAWCWQGISADAALYRESEGQTAHVKRDKLETYLTAPFWGKLCFPGKYFQFKAREEWRKLVFVQEGTFYKRADGHKTNLDEQREELKRIEKDLYRFADEEKFEVLRANLNEQVTKAEGEWKKSLSKAVEKLHKECAAEGDVKLSLSFDEMPSLTNEVEKVVQSEKELYLKEEKLYGEEDKTLTDRSDREKYCNYLNELAKRLPFIYSSFQGKRALLISNQKDALDREVDERPYFVKEAAEKFNGMSANFRFDVNFTGLVVKADNQLKKLAEEYENFNNKYIEAKTSKERLTVCKDAISNLKDHPSITMQSEDGWNRRKDKLEKQIKQSQEAEKDLLAKLDEKKNSPSEQIVAVRGAIDNGSELSPEKKERFEGMLQECENQWKAASNAWIQLESAFSDFKQDGQKYESCYKKLEEYKSLVIDTQNRINGIKGYDHVKIENELKNEKDRTDVLKSEYQKYWNTRSKTGEEIKSFRLAADKLTDLRKTRHHDFAEEKIKDWANEIDRVKEDCQETSSDEQFQHAKDLLEIRRNYEDRLGLGKVGQEQLDYIQGVWNGKHLNKTKQDATRSNTRDALDLWIEYLKHNDEGWQAYREEGDEPMKEYKRLRELFAKELVARIEQCKKENQNRDVTPSVYEGATNRITGIKYEFDKRELPVSEELNTAHDETMDFLKEKVLAWHKKELEGILKKLPSVGQHCAVIKWDQLEKIDHRLKEMDKAECVRSQLLAEFYERWKERKRKLEEKEFDIGLNVTSFKFKLKEVGNGKTPTLFMPGFVLSCRHDKAQEVFRYEEKKAQKDPAHLERREVTPGDKDHQYIVFTGKPDQDFKEPVRGVKMKKGVGLDFVLKLMRSSDNKEVKLDLLTKEETPASLSYGNKEKFAECSFLLKYKDWSEYKFELSNFSLKVELLDSSCLNAFRIPSTADAFFKWLER